MREPLLFFFKKKKERPYLLFICIVNSNVKFFFFLVESGRFYLKETEFIQHQHLYLGHKAEVPPGQTSP